MSFEITLSRRVLKQPTPAIVAGGDCGACCIAGLLGISTEEAYSLQDPDCRPKNKKDTPVPFSWQHMSHVLTWRSRDMVVAAISDIPFWPDEHRGSFAQYGFPSWQANLSWARYVRMALHGGYYGLCSISAGGDGPLKDHDHWVMLCGIREYSVPHATMKGASRIDKQLLVSCSSKCPEGYWIDHLEFLRKHGGYNTILVRPEVEETAEDK